jgi:hypothetical protein
VRITELEYTAGRHPGAGYGKAIQHPGRRYLRDVQLEVLALDATGSRLAQQRTSFRYLFPTKPPAWCRSLKSIQDW